MTQTVLLQCETSGILFLREDKDVRKDICRSVCRFSDLHGVPEFLDSGCNSWTLDDGI